MKRVENLVTVYGTSHYYTHGWEHTDFYCPSCGKQEVWVEDGPGDYYAGPDYLCRVCGGGMGCPNHGDRIVTETMRQLQAEKADEPPVGIKRGG